VGEVSYKGHRYPAEIIAHCVWLYHRFPLSLREVEEIMLVRGVIVTYETIRQWCAKFGPVYAAGLRRRQPRPGDKWHLDEVFLTITGRRHYLWRAVDQDGNVLDILVQPRRDAKAAKRHCQLEQSEGDFRRFASAIHQVACDVSDFPHFSNRLWLPHSAGSAVDGLCTG